MRQATQRETMSYKKDAVKAKMPPCEPEESCQDQKKPNKEGKSATTPREK